MLVNIWKTNISKFNMKLWVENTNFLYWIDSHITKINEFTHPNQKRNQCVVQCVTMLLKNHYIQNHHLRSSSFVPTNFTLPLRVYLFIIQLKQWFIKPYNLPLWAWNVQNPSNTTWTWKANGKQYLEGWWGNKTPNPL